MIRMLWLLLPCLLFSQPQFFGYFESEFDGIQMDGKGYSFGYHKFRFDVEARPSDHVLIGANFNIQKYWGQTTWNVLDFIPPAEWYALTENFGYYIPYQISDTLLLDNVYMRLSLGFMDLTLGRQQLSPGVGYAWNPTDLFNSKTLLDPSYEQTGVEAIKAEIPVGNRVNLGVLIQPQESWDKSTRLVRAKTRLGHFDLELVAADTYWKRSSHILWGLPPDETHRKLVGTNIVGELLGWGVWTETAYNTLTGDDDFLEMVVGLDHTFDNSLYLLLEILHNENGAANEVDLTYENYFLLLNGETHSLMQDYGFLYLNHPTFDYVSLSLIGLANFNDQSGSLGPQIDWSMFENTTLSLQTSIFWGDVNSEFGLQDWGLRLRVRSDF